MLVSLPETQAPLLIQKNEEASGSIEGRIAKHIIIATIAAALFVTFGAAATFGFVLTGFMFSLVLTASAVQILLGALVLAVFAGLFLKVVIEYSIDADNLLNELKA